MTLPYEVRVVDQAGSSYGTLDNATVKPCSSELNVAGSVEIGLATTDSDAALMVPGREIQIYYAGGTDPIFWGPIVRPQAGLDETTWRCVDCLWYFGHRFMGRADRVNQLTNGDFESSETGWSFSGVTHAVETTIKVEGSKSEKLTGGAADHNTYAWQIYTHAFPTPPNWPGDFMTGSAWVWASPMGSRWT